jgi:hypothetical protein
MPVTAERLAQGMSFAEYRAQMQENQEKFAANYAAVEIPPAAGACVADPGGPLNVLVLTEDWCGDSATYLPVLARLVEGAAQWNVRVFRRDENLDLADAYLDAGKWRSVPVIVLFDAQMRELGRLIEHPTLAKQERQAVIDRLAVTHPAIQAGAPYKVQSDEAKELLADALRDLRWTRTPAWQAAVVAEVCAALERMERR